MDKRENDKNLIGHPSDYGSRTPEGEGYEPAEHSEADRTADGDPLVERGTAGNEPPPER